LSYRSPLYEELGPVEIRMDDGIVAAGLQIGDPADALAIQTAFVVQILWAHSFGLPVERSEVRANPGIIVGVCYQKNLGPVGVEACVRGFGYLRRQEIFLNRSVLFGSPRVGGELAVGLVYLL